MPLIDLKKLTKTNLKRVCYEIHIRIHKNSLNKRSKIAESLCLEQILKKNVMTGEKILEENAHCSALIESLQEELPERYKNIPNLLLEGYTQTEVASILGVPRQRVYEKVKAMREYLKRNMPETQWL